MSAIGLLLLLFGFFGCKLQTIEAIAVVQVSALFTMTIEDMGPTYQGLSNLGYALGITAI